VTDIGLCIVRVVVGLVFAAIAPHGSIAIAEWCTPEQRPLAARTRRRRVPTRPSAGSRQRRLAGKQRRAAVKRWRSRPGEGE